MALLVHQWCVVLVIVIFAFAILIHSTNEAMADLTCSGGEWSLDECSWSSPDAACSAHSEDTVVYCGKAGSSTPNGATRLISPDGGPAVDGKG